MIKNGEEKFKILLVMEAAIVNNNIDSIRDELDTLTKIIIETVPVEQIYLFGSYAYGKPHKDSDYDIYVVLEDNAPMRDLEAMDAIGLATYRKIEKPLDLIVHKKSLFLDRADGIATIEKTVLLEGMKLYG
jgi:predicted nucleotidyltransferase